MSRALVVALALLASATAFAAPRVALLVVSHPGLTDEQSDEIAYDLAGVIATQIEGEAIAGPSVRELLTEGVPPGCEEQPACGRKLSAKLKADEVLFLAMKKSAKKDVSAVLHRVARDPDRIPTDGDLLLTGSKAKRGKALSAAVSALYPTGTVHPFTEPVRVAAPPPEEPEEPVAERERPSQAKPVYKKAWFWGVVAGGGALVIAAGIVGIVFAMQPGPTGAPIELPP